MEINNLRERYKVNKSNVEQAYEYQLGLKNDEKYEKRVDDTFVQITKIFKEMYPNVVIKPPKGRKKSNMSMRIKIHNMEIERLCKLYAIEGITDNQKTELCKQIIDSMQGKEKEKVIKILFGEIENLNDIDSIISTKEIPEKSKTALLRILKVRLRKENIENREFLENELDEKYGEKKVIKTGMLKDDLIRWSSIDQITPVKRKNLNNPSEYLKIKDLMGMKLQIINVPDDIKTKSEKLIEYIECRKQIEKKIELLKSNDKTSENELKRLEDEKQKYEDLCALEFVKEFSQILMTNNEILDRLNIRVIPEGYKHKEKQNGYIAEHIKFEYIDNPEYIFELQLHSAYRECLSRTNGSAAHDKRSGKAKVLLNLLNRIVFEKDVKDKIPEWRCVEQKNDGEYVLRKYSTLENINEYYAGCDKYTPERREKICKYINENSEELKII